MVIPCNDEQRGRATRLARNRTRSGLTHLVRVIEGANVCLHGTSQGLSSGQQRNLGLSELAANSPRCAPSLTASTAG